VRHTSLHKAHSKQNSPILVQRDRETGQVNGRVGWLEGTDRDSSIYTETSCGNTRDTAEDDTMGLWEHVDVGNVGGI